MKSSIIDVPREHTQADLFGIQAYQNALIKYIRLTDTPITIALQGEWGSGKTSLMNLLRYHLCDVDSAPYFPIWINTWQYSLMKSPQQAIMSILEGIINQIGELNPNEQKWEESKRKIGGLFKKMATVGTKVAAGAVGIDGGLVDELFDGGQSASTSDITQLKAEIAKLIDDALSKDSSKSGFTFYIDDLDRIDPPAAVEILELLKNIFDLKKCIFILAIDYDVVIKGLKPKFGELTAANEREFRSFFDKIIQLPFSMPVASYSVDSFLVDALDKIEFFTEKELADMSLAETLSTITRLSVGTNPRSLKRLTNTLALISIIYDEQYGEKSNVTTLDKLINFALVCVQIAYPYIYNQLTEEPDFKSWNEKIASKLKLRPLTELERESLDSTEEFDEDWEKVLFRMCQMETYLSNRAFSISGLLNKIAQIIGNDEQLGEIIESILEMSAVTNIKAFDAPKRVKVSEIQWAEKLWNPVKEQLSQSLNIKMSIPKDKGYSHISSEAIKGAIYTFSYSVKSGVAAVSLETFGGEEIKRVVEQKIATAPADHPIRSAVVSQGKKNKNKWNWSIQINIDKYDPTLIQWYVDTVLSMYTLLEK
jgi:hypothetical protein